MKTLFITHDIHDPYFNLASEEYLLKEKGCCCIYLWVNSPAVIVGINQNTLQEVNLSYTDSHGIKVVRRQTGGGAVYHDEGNICYTVIAPYDMNADNYRKFTAPVIGYLNTLGVAAEFSGRNDIVIDGKKISGNAQTVYKDRIMHHGTLLFDTDMTVLAGALKPNKLKMESKGIKSVRARVTNISESLPVKMTAAQFKEGLSQYFLRDCELYEFTEHDLSRIRRLVEEKYSRYDWNVGRSPKCANVFEERFPFGTMRMDFDIEDGKMRNVKITGDFFSLKPAEELEELLNGRIFTQSEIRAALSGVPQFIVGADADDIVSRLFQ